jgi:hypothetical protein
MDYSQQHQHQQVSAEAANLPSANHSLKSRRRTSLPSSVKTSDTRPTKRAPNYIRTQAASPQVISSLIDQLSAISIPAHNHFENLLVGYDNGLPPSATPSIRTHSGRNSLAGHDGASLDYYHSTLKEQNDLYPDDACEPPVIRTSKPPSGLSPLTAPKKRDKPHSLGSYIGRSGGSSCSLQSTHSNRSASSFGNISIEPGVPKDIAGGASNRSSAESKRSAKGHRSLMYMSSRERLRQKETERRRVTVHTLDDLPSHGSPKKAAAQLFPYEDTIKEEPSTKEDPEPLATESSRFAQRFSSRNNSPRRLRINLVDGPDGETQSDKRLIPERGSSLRHTGSPTRKSKKRHTKGSSRQKQSETVMVPEQGEKDEVDPESEMKEKILKELEQEENDVAQRIRELKEQKRRRDKLAGKMPVDDGDAGVITPNVPRVSSIPSPELSPTSTVSSVSEVRRQDSTKAHRVLGIPIESGTHAERLPAKALKEYDFDEAEPPAIRSLRHSRHRSLTVNDGDDLTPLPINYALALQRLDEPAPLPPLLEPPREMSPPRSISNASTVATKSSGDSTSPRRASSLAVGERSAVGRRAVTTSAIMGTSSGHKHSSSVTDSNSSISGMQPALRSTSDDLAPRHKSMHISSEAAHHSMQLQRKRTLTKKRWSHPDLPAKAEKEHNEKAERAEAKSRSRAAAVQTPPISVIEERPASLDSIDVEVQTFLNSPRLSQKIRHPQTGRTISFSEVGDPQGYAVFVCVGMGLTRYVMAFYDQLALTLKLRLITPDRPGIGGSQVDPNGTPLNWPGESCIPSKFVVPPLTSRRRRSCDMSGLEDQQVLSISTFGWRCLRARNIVAYATAHPRQSAFTSTLDSTIPDGTYRNQSGLTPYAAITKVTTLFASSPSFSAQSCQLDISERNKR